MKQTIRLKESELKRMISESVKGIINELDWKTYMNAAKKAYDSAENDDEEDRAWKFADAAERAFNRDYGYVEPDDNLEYYGQKANQDVHGNNFTPSGQYGVGMGSWTPLDARMHSVRNIGKGETNNSIINPKSKMKPSKSTIDAYQRAEDEMEKYANGKYKYKKGKGWQLKETINKKIKRIVSESIRKINEGGHLYHKDDDGNVWTNSKETYRGVPGSTYIWHGEWSDPEILWKGVSLNANDVEEDLWYSYKEECEEYGEQPTENGFEEWAKNTDIASALDELAWAANGNP